MYEIKKILTYGTMFLGFFALKDLIERILTIFVMLTIATIYNIYTYMTLTEIGFYWGAANIVLAVFFIMRIIKGDYKKVP